MKTLHSLIAFLWAIVIFFPLSASSQMEWKKIGSFGSRISIIYFYNEDLGFVGIGTVPGSNISVTSTIYRTSNGGLSWMMASSPRKSGYGVNDIVMEDKLHGWAAADKSSGKLWHTIDGGLSWNVVPSDGSEQLSNSVRRTSKGMLLADFLKGNIELSTDEGKTFKQVYRSKGGDNMLGIDFVDPNHGVASTQFRNAENNWAYTSDGGLTWKESNFGTESWTLRGVKSTSLFFAAPEGYSNQTGYLTEVMRSIDYGKSWQHIRTLPFRATSDLECSETAIYIQTGSREGGSYPEGPGIYRSLDSGLTWHGLGGPEYWSDSHFAVTNSCRGTTIYCADESYNVYKGFDSVVRHVMPSDGPNHLTMKMPEEVETFPCTSGSTIMNINMEECYKLVIDSAMITGPDSKYFSFAYTFVKMILSGKNDSIRVYFKHHHEQEEYNAFLHLKGYYDYGWGNTQPFDTLIPLKAIVRATPPNLMSDRNTIIFTTETPCSHLPDTTVTLTNSGCDTLWITKASRYLSPNFSLDTVALPIMLVPGGSIRIRFHFAPDTIGEYNALASFETTSRFADGRLDLSLVGAKAEFEPPKLVSMCAALRFRDVALCEREGDTLLTLTNIGCDTLSIISGPGILASEFRIDSLHFPIILAPEQTASIKVRFQPHAIGSFSTKMQFVTSSHNMEKDISIDVIGMCKASVPEFSASSYTIDFNTVSTCELSRDTTISITNAGCDTMSIVTAPTGFPSEFTMDAVKLPVILAPNQSFDLHFHFHPSGDGAFRFSPEFVAERFGLKTIIPIYLTGTGEQGRAILRSEPQAFSFPQTHLCSSPDSIQGIIFNPGCETLIVDEVSLVAESDFSLTQIALPAAIAPRDTIRFMMYFTPLNKGDRRGTLTVGAHSAHDKMRTSEYQQFIAVGGGVGDGTRTISAAPSGIDVGALSLCDIKVASITLTNSGCDTLMVLGADMKGNGFALASSFPLQLLPGESTSVSITTYLDTTNKKSSSDADLYFQTTADNQLAPIHLRRDYMYPLKYNLALERIGESSFAGDTIRFALKSDKPFSSVNSIDFNLHYNSDILSFVRIESSNAITITDGHIHINGVPTIQTSSDVIATIVFATSLTSDSVSDLVVSNTHLNISDPSFEECTAQVSQQGSSFTFQYQCGDRILSKHLANGISVAVTSIHPNPAIGELTLDLNAKTEQDISVMIFDALGNKRSEKHIHIAPGKHSELFDVADLPSGMYLMQVMSGASQRSIHFIKGK